MAETQTNWRYRCPEGHNTWRTLVDGYYCQQCQQRFDELRDMKREPLRY